MEENSDVQMETDMSCNISDISETQQMSENHDDVEMVIVVEKVEDDENTGSDQTQSEPSDSENFPISPRRDMQPVKTYGSSRKDSQIIETIQISQKQIKVASPKKESLMSDGMKRMDSPKIFFPMDSIDVAIVEVSEKDSSQEKVPTNKDGTLNNEISISLPSKDVPMVDVKLKTYSQKVYVSPNKDATQKIQTHKTLSPSKDNQNIQIDKTASADKDNQKTQTDKTVSSGQDNQKMQTDKTLSSNKDLIQDIQKDTIVSSNIDTKQNMPTDQSVSSTKDLNQIMQIDKIDFLSKEIPQMLQADKVAIPTKKEKENQVTEKDKSLPSKDGGQKIQPQKTVSPCMDVQLVDIQQSQEKPAKPIDLQKVEVATDSTSNTRNSNEDKEKLDNDINKIPPSPTPPPDSNIKSANTESTLNETTNKDAINSNQTQDNKKEDIVFNTTIDMSEQSNDSQTNSDISEKEHNKSISRELKSLIKSAKESKIISECTQLTSKTRKSRTAMDCSNLSLNSPLEAEKIQGVRRSSNNSQRSNSSEKSEKLPKRSMRSQNPEFVNKVKQFLNSVTGKFNKNESDDEEIEENKKENNASPSPSPKKKKQMEVPQPEVSPGVNKLRSDTYCWRCHWAVEQSSNDKGHPPMQCTVCPRTFHYKCLSGNERNKITIEKSWVCPECLSVLHAESSETRSPAMKKISLGLLCELLQHAMERMMDLNGVEPFLNPVDRTAFPDYDKYVVHPMDLTLMKNNIAEGLYGSTEAFLADAQWILHNSIIFNTLQSKLTGGARALVRSCRAEMGEIEACPECYAAAHARRPTWFTDVCSTPHILLWAKLKGFPYWPAKGMSVNSTGLVDVRFFGAHDRAWVPARDCFLYCEKDPNNFRTKRQDILDSMVEAEQHIHNITRKYGKFVFPPFKTQFDPAKLNEQLKMMIPTFEGELRSLVKDKSHSSPLAAKEKSRSNSKSSKSSVNDGDISETEETTPSRKMADGAEIAREEEDFCIEMDKSMDIDVCATKEKEPSRKRRRSDLEEAVITIIETSNSEKRKKIDNEEKSKVSLPMQSKTEKNEQNVSKSEDQGKTVELIRDNEKNKSSTSQLDAKESLNTTVENESSVDRPPIKIKIKTTRSTTPKVKEESTTKEKSTTPKRHVRSGKLHHVEKDQHDTRARKRHSGNKSLNNSQIEKIEEGTAKANEKDSAKDKKNDKDNSTEKINDKDNVKEKKNDKDNKKEKKNDKDNAKEKKSDKDATDKSNETKNKDIETDKSSDKSHKSNGTEIQKFVKERIQFDDDTPIIVVSQNITNNANSGLPTISSVRSLSNCQNSETNNKAVNAKTVEVSVANSDSSVFTPTSTDNVRNMKEAVNKLQKLRSETEPPVGRVGVRSFARMTSSPEKQNKLDNVEVEIKSEPIDFDDADRQSEKLNMMNAFHLRPVNPSSSNLRGVRINKVVVAPIARKSPASKPPEVRVKAKKTFPQPKKVDDGRSELNSKNSMVYIPIQPPSTQAPAVRPTRPVTVNGSANTQTVRPQVATITSNVNSFVNTLTTPLISLPMASTLSNPIPTPTVVSNTNQGICVPTVGQVSTNVHTVPLITSVNGQWTFSLQPVMSVGRIEGTTSPPVVNGLLERNNSAPLVPIATAQPIAPAPVVQPSPPTSNPSVQPPPTTQPTPTTPSSSKDTPGEPPRLQQRPPLLNPLDSNTPIGSVPAPSSAGPLTAKLNQNAVKLADFFRNLLEDSLEKIDEPTSQATALRVQLEQMQWRHQQEIKEFKHNHDLTITEMRASFEKEKSRAINEARRNAQVELETAVKAAKSKQWCANCMQEAQFYCCWNTSYCDYPCQRTHWTQHFATCTQQRTRENNTNDNGNLLEKRLQPAPDNLPKNTQAPSLTVGGKIAPTRVYAQDSQQQKASIIVSMVEDQSGNQTVKCVGTYKPGAQQVSPLIINKQLLTNDESAKKVVTSGGYLIVGAGSGNQPLVTPSRRTHTIKYYT